MKNRLEHTVTLGGCTSVVLSCHSWRQVRPLLDVLATCAVWAHYCDWQIIESKVLDDSGVKMQGRATDVAMFGVIAPLVPPGESMQAQNPQRLRNNVRCPCCGVIGSWLLRQGRDVVTAQLTCLLLNKERHVQRASRSQSKCALAGFCAPSALQTSCLQQSASCACLAFPCLA